MLTTKELLDESRNRDRTQFTECKEMELRSLSVITVQVELDGHVCRFEEESPASTSRIPRFGFQEHQVFWNERGSIFCACCHIPYPGSDTWVWERWGEITPETMVEIDREGGQVACEGCGKEPRRIVRVTEKGRN